ncbi:MAG: long-chain-fatty-acid-CoA ligase [Mycobacterium sp.]|nr:long-chain-fatty-acid-CoA ligase [Mycobacterium sp.]
MRELVYPRLLLATAERHSGDRVLITEDGEDRTFAAHVTRVMLLVAGMRERLGLAPGDRFAVMAANSARHIELWHAALFGGGVINPLNLRFSGPELAHVLRDSGAKVVFTDALFANTIAAVREEAGIETVVLIAESAADAPVPDGVAADLMYETVIEAGAAAGDSDGSIAGKAWEEPEEDDPCVLMYTGGTTGLPKGVLLEQRAMTLTAYHAGLKWRHTPGDVYLLQTPMFHAASFGGIAIVPAFGATTAFVPFFDPAAVIAAIPRFGVTNTLMVPTMIAMIMNHPDFRPETFGSLRQLTYGASPMPTPLLERLLHDYPQVEIFQGYGMTETAALLTSLGPEDHVPGSPRLQSAGQAMHGIALSIQDEAGRRLGPHETGEVCARSGNVMREYWNQPDQTAEAFRGGWYHTGDVGYLDEDGYLYLVDRVKDMIVSGGENVYSTEVENAIADHPAVAQVAVIGIPDEKWGEAVHAVVVLKPGAQVTEAELRDYARRSIAGYKVPKSVEFRTGELPLSGALKVLKRELRAPYWEGRERSVN